MSELPDLNVLRDHFRVLILFAANEGEAALIEQKKMLQNHAAGLEERDLKIFQIAEQSKDSRNLRRRFGVAPDESFAVVLVGKDGTRKLHKSHPVAADQLFRLIDSMPMRKGEMRRR